MRPGRSIRFRSSAENTRAVWSSHATIESVAANTNKNALEYQIDYAKYYDKIIVTGFANPPTNDIPWTPADIYAEDLADNGGNPEIWGVVNNEENFFKFFCGLEIGDGTTVTEFEASNEFLFRDL